ncbi:hypothetical protein FACS1894192_01340 [Bacilli bacterium]|nr:hypothetical protein FACS1894192_01340 [Bacilli bacterium]
MIKIGKNRNQSRKFIFSQYLNPKYWAWEDEKLTLFEDWETNKAEIFEEIYNSLKTMKDFEEIALIVHDKDKKANDSLILPHIHGYIAFKGAFDLERVARRIGIEPQYVEKPKGGKHVEINNKPYLIHAKNPEKYQYSASEVETFGTFDYVAYIEDNADELKKRAATVKREALEISFDYVHEQLLTGKMKLQDLRDDPDLKLLYGRNEDIFNKAVNFYGADLGYERLKLLKNREYKLTVLYIQAPPGVGKTQLTGLLAEKLKDYGIKNGFESEIYSASSSNPFDEYLGEDILILDDLRVKSLSVSDWLKLFDPLNTARMSARYRNKMVVPRVIIVANYKKPVDFFQELKGEDLDQFVRRIENCVEIKSKQFPLGDDDSIFNVSEVFRSDYPRHIQLSDDEIMVLNFDYKQIFTENGKREQIADRLIKEIIVPRSFPQKKERRITK